MGMAIFQWTLVVFVILLFAYSVMPNIVIRLMKLHCLWKLPAKRFVALTFDDGPNPRYTPRLLNVLRTCGVKATFFVVVEKALKHPEVIREMIRDGHDVQVHGLTHAFLPLLTPTRSFKQVSRGRDLLRDRFGIVATLFRPPWGLCNLASLAAAKRVGCTVVTWSVMVGDWRNVASEELLRRILLRMHPGAVIVLHDNDETWGSQPGAPEHVIALIPRLIDQLQGMGYRVGSLAEHGVSQIGGQA